MSNSALKLITTIVFIIGAIVIMLGFGIWERSMIYNPDAAVTVYNDSTKKKTQAYLIGDMQVYIDQTFRTDMELFKLFVKGSGLFRNPSYDEIKPGDASLSLNRDDIDIDPNPFIVRLKVKNVSSHPIFINADNFMIRTGQGELIKVNHAWQEVMGKSNLFSGTLGKDTLEPNEEQLLWLVYGTKSHEQKPGYVYQEYMRINYGSDNEMLATKVEFPFNYVPNTPIGNSTKTNDYIYVVAIMCLMAWMGVCGAVYYWKTN